MSECFAAAHRGLSSEVTENTLAAFQAAAAAGFPAIELDLRLTRDGEVVVLHDAGIEGTTHGNGKVADMAYDELRSYRTPHGPVPRLDDVLSAMAQWRGVWNLEVKAVRATEPALHLVEHHGLEARVLVTSFDPAVLAIAREVAPAVARGLILAGPVDADDVAMATGLGCRWVNVQADQLTAPVVRQLQEAGLRVGAWTVNDVAAALALARRGIACVITDVRAVGAALGNGKATL